ncbi:MAG: outer membrane beta-barrel protein [Croceibacterium sp.]
MKKGLALFAATVSVAALSAPAAAQEATWSGPWIAGMAGYDINKAGSSTDVDTVENDQSAEGLTYGVGVGYDVDMGGMVIGAEAELTDSTAKADNQPDLDSEEFGLGEVNAGRDIYVGARVGFKATPSTLVYAKGGYTNARFNYLGTDGTTDYNTNVDVDGWRAGAGVEQKLGSNAFAKVEYRYSNYSKGEVDFEAENIADSDRFNVDLDRHQIMAGVGFRF